MTRPTYQVGRFTLTPCRQLMDGATPIAIGRRPLALLSALAQARGDVVTKDELMLAVWPNAIVEENAIQVHVTALRKLLGVDARLLSTVRGLGYRLAAYPAAAPEIETQAQPTGRDGALAMCFCPTCGQRLPTQPRGRWRPAERRGPGDAAIAATSIRVTERAASSRPARTPRSRR